MIDEATPTDAVPISALVNRAYRPDPEARGWTHEAELVSGARTNAGQVLALFKDESTLLVMREASLIVACVHVERIDSACHIGMLATDPALQGQGLGHRMLAAAEDLARHRYNATQIKMSVLSSRPELLAYYQRRGYQLTGGVSPYPADAGVGTPNRRDLQVLDLIKHPVATAGKPC